MATRSLEFFGRYQESSEKFDYFVCGVAGALFAYIGQNYAPKKIELGVSSLEPAALLLLAAAFFVGLKQIETALTAKRINYRMLDAAERAGNLTKALSGGPGPYFNEDGGELLNRQTVESLRLKRLQQKEDLNPILDKTIRHANRLTSARDILLLLGFVAIFASKVLQPYL